MLEYNTSRNQLVIKEYGRNVQKMIEYAISIEDRQKRTETAKAIIRVMAEIHPDTKENNNQTELQNQSSDYWRKLWDHLIIISNYRLDVDAPFPKPAPEDKSNKKTQHRYEKSKISLRTYGRNMESIIKKVAQYPMPQREIMGKILANHLKKLYILYNRNTVNDDLIINQLRELSGGNIVLPEDFQLFSTKEIMRNNGNAHFVQAGSNKKAGNKKSRKRKRKPVGNGMA
jgi:spore cortex formation protein SpoVR/YcgB (stage V sporulation)